MSIITAIFKKLSSKKNSSPSPIAGFIRNMFGNLEKEMRILIKKSRDLAQTNYDLGIKHMKAGEYYDACFRFRMTLRFQKDYLYAYYNLARCLILRGKTEEAKPFLLKALELKQDFSEARYVLATVDSNTPLEVIPGAIVEEFYDQLAPDFEQQFVEGQHYTGYQTLAEAVFAADTNKTNPKEALDLGCGTGLCGTALKHLYMINSLPSLTLTGVDISAKMLARAKKQTLEGKPVYDYLKQESYQHYIKHRKIPYDYIVAGLVFSYQGQLEESFAAIRPLLKTGGVFGLTLRKTESAPFILAETKRYYYHSLEHIKQSAAAAGFTEISCTETELYDGMPGYICLFA